MASCSTPQWSTSYTPQVKLTVTQTASTDTTVTLTWVLDYVTHGYAASTNGVGRSYTVKIAGATVKTGTFNINGKYSTEIASGTKVINKTTAKQSISFSVSFNFDITWTNVYGGTKSASGSIAVAAKTSYKVSYNANGGTGAPSAQTKWHGTAITLSSTKPTRTGYTFQGWGTSTSDTSVDYKAGASYSANAAITLYAIWKVITYTVTFDANTGTGAPAAQTKTYGVALTLNPNNVIPTKTNYNFLGWGTSADATTVTYASSGAYTANADITLYAIWELAYLAPRITNFTLERCDSNGNPSDEGTSAKVIFSWACDKEVSSITVCWKNATSTTWNDKDKKPITGVSGVNGTVNTIVGSDGLSGEYSYDIQVVVADSVDESSQTRTLDGFNFVIDFLGDGTGVAIGKPAGTSELLDVNWDINTNGSLHINNVLALRENSNNMVLSADGGNIYLRPTGSTDGTGEVIVTSEGHVRLKNNAGLYQLNASGAARMAVTLNSSNQYIFGNGGYANSEGASYFDGNSVNIRSKGAIAITSPTAGLTARQYGVNKVLWSGCYYMTASHTANLTEAVSAQPNGIVLVWSYYDDGPYDTNWNMFFIPKHYVANHSGKSTNVFIVRSGLQEATNKCIYVNDTSIVGNAVNSGSSTTGASITNTPNSFVLRYVIGV